MTKEAQMRKRKTEGRFTLPAPQSHHNIGHFATTNKCPWKATGENRGANAEIARTRTHRHRNKNPQDQANRGTVTRTLRGSNRIGTPPKNNPSAYFEVVNRKIRIRNACVDRVRARATICAAYLRIWNEMIPDF